MSGVWQQRFMLNAMCAPDVLQTHTDSLLKLNCLFQHPAHFLQGALMTYKEVYSFQITVKKKKVKISIHHLFICVHLIIT